MRKLRFVRLTLQPSAESFLLVALTTLLVLGVVAFLAVSESGLFYEYLLGADSSSQLIETSRSTISAFNETVFGNPTLNKILFFGMWMAIGLVVYITLSGLGATVGAVDEEIHELKDASLYQKRLESEVRLRIATRVMIAILWFIYTVLFIKFFLPFSVLSTQIAAAQFSQLSGGVYALLGLIVLGVSLHLHVVMARFFMLRPRLQGGWDDIIADEHSTHQL